MEKIDSKILAIYQAISDWFQDWFGKSNFDLAMACMMANCIGCGIITTVNFFSKNYLDATIDPAVQYIFINIVGKEIREAQRRSDFNSPIMSIFTMAMEYKRILALFICSYFIIRSLLNIFNSLENHNNLHVKSIGELISFLSILSIFYFMGCRPKPKKPSKIKKSWEKLREKVSELKPLPKYQPA